MSDDWQLLKDALTHTPTLVISVSPQGPVGLLREGAALFYGLNQMLRHGSGYPLIDRLRRELQAPTTGAVPGEPAPLVGPRAEPGPSDTRPQADRRARRDQEPEKDLDTLRRETLERCRRANQVLVSQYSPEEAAYYRRGLLWVCLQTARAAREGGGLFNFGAVQVTEDEKEVLRQIAYAFGLPANEAQVDTLPDAPLRPIPAGLAGRLSSEEWTLVRQAPLWVGLAVVTASPSGPLGVSRELNVLPRILQQARQQHPDNPILNAVWDDLSNELELVVHSLNADLPVQQGGGQAANSVLVDHAIQRLGQAAGVLDARLDQAEAIEFKQVLLELAHQVAGAAREGGFLGLGGHTISTHEQDALRRIADTLHV